MNCPDKFVQYMHEYLDEEISTEHEKELKIHLQTCEDCYSHFHELEKAIALVKSTSHIQAPPDFTANIMARLPKEKKKVGIQRWFRHHPMLTAASLFMVLMLGSVLSNWNQEQEFSVSKQPNLIVQNDTVIVPKGEVVEGDIVVRNGKIQIEGQVKGDVTVINGDVTDMNGEKYLASAGQVTGEIREVNEVFDWIWFQIKKTAKEVVNVFNKNEEATN